MTRYKNDPRWIEVKFDGDCAKPSCGNIIKAGERAFYYPQSRSMYGDHCGHGEEASADFHAHAADEESGLY